MNPSTVAKTTDALVNELPPSSLYTLLHAAYELRLEAAGAQPYGSQGPALSMALVRQGMAIDAQDFVDPGESTCHHVVPATVGSRPKDLIYGGEAHFDNMRRFFMGNGFDSVVDQKEYQNPVFTGSRGVSDEDLLQVAHERFEEAGDAPFFSLVFSSSNRTPFEFPDERIELYDAEKQTVNNAVNYAERALGRFFEQATQSAYWRDTFFWSSPTTTCGSTATAAQSRTAELPL